MSSRNAYLSTTERAIAPRLYQTLIAAAARLRAGASSTEIEQEGMDALSAAGFVPDYLSIRRRADLLPPAEPPRDEADRALILLAAARLGRARLIDNLACDLGVPVA
jgi:pantoate--beta-alanine ligase